MKGKHMRNEYIENAEAEVVMNEDTGIRSRVDRLFSRAKGFFEDAMGITEVRREEEERLLREEARFWKNRDIVVIVSAEELTAQETIAEVLEEYPDAAKVVWCTTRQPEAKRGGLMEKEGEDYFFIERRHFELLEETGKLLDSYSIDGDRYGIPEDHIGFLRITGKKALLLCADCDGALAIKEEYPAVHTVLMLPESRSQAIANFRSEGGAERDELEARLSDIQYLIGQADRFDHTIIADFDGKASEALKSIVRRVIGHTSGAKSKFDLLQESFADVGDE